MSSHFDPRTDVPAIRRAHAAMIGSLIEDLLPSMRMAAAGLGYAIAVHGSLARDIDLVAIPWTDQAGSAEKLVAVLVGVVNGVCGRAWADGPADKPHGRKAVMINHAGHFAEIDLSIMPRVEKGE